MGILDNIGRERWWPRSPSNPTASCSLNAMRPSTRARSASRAASAFSMACSISGLKISGSMFSCIIADSLVSSGALDDAGHLPSSRSMAIALLQLEAQALHVLGPPVQALFNFGREGYSAAPEQVVNLPVGRTDQAGSGLSCHASFAVVRPADVRKKGSRRQQGPSAVTRQRRDPAQPTESRLSTIATDHQSWVGGLQEHLPKNCARVVPQSRVSAAPKTCSQHLFGLIQDNFYPLLTYPIVFHDTRQTRSSAPDMVWHKQRVLCGQPARGI